ncbi:reverse transcriptase family protein [Rhizophagus clarus]|uniref:Reverse transcriptase family protein n=1 Tax=Rhizophagus clarus TaxID=94130 RepID=A0A8H3KPV7_9GLOM|nr:reverse transcriptase family protein [Rhizophagus clarus]
MHNAKCNIKQKKKKVKQNHHPLYDSDLKRDLNMLKGMLNKIHKAKLDFNDRSIENKKKIIAHITALHRRSDDQYQPKRDVQHIIYSDLMKYLTLDEWIDNVKSLPNNKAAGPSGISYKMLKNLNEDNQSFLHAFICVCMDLNDIPDEWKKATIYPIPKPKPFFTNLTNTRLITLLETPQKAFISLLNRRLSQILKNNNVLKGNQFAALPGNSTFELIRMINEIIQDAKENNKELWLLSQDLGKAYDHVNIFMLEKAIKHIKIPSNFIKIIFNLFKNRQNQVITAYGLTNPYDMLIGIDQGEVISPLLYEDTSEKTEKLTISSSAYMDDTQWLAPSQNNLEKILKIADSFYKLNDIQVNKEKSELLVRYKQGRYRPKLEPHEPVTLSDNQDQAKITNILIQINDASVLEKAKQTEYTSKPILLNTNNYPNYYVGTLKKNVDFDTNFFMLEYYNIDLVNNKNKLEISRCQGCNNTTSTYTPLCPRRDQLQESFCNIEYKQLLQHFEFNSKLEALHIIQQHLKEEDTLSFYTDGSLINANTQAASMTTGFIRVSNTNNITHSFTTTIENWPSSLRAELFAILLSLIVSPYGCRVNINTDSQNSINIIQRIYNNPIFSIRNYFRFPNNNIVINNIVSIIKAKNLTLRFNKVKAHNNNYFNERINQKCKIVHYDSTPALMLKQQYFDNIQFIPQWVPYPLNEN